MLLLLVACAAHHEPRPTAAALTSGDAPSRSELRREGLALAPVVLVRDLPAPPLPPPPTPGRIEAQLEAEHLPEPTVLDPVRDAAFLRGDFVGNVRFGGGVMLSGDVALDSRARILEFNQQDAYATQASAWLTESVRAALDDQGIPLGAAPAAVTATLTRAPVRGLDPDDGRDNVNLPRSSFRPEPIAADASASGWLLVPFVRSYYTHNGGWFIGQRYGCLAGARIEAVLALYDRRTGAPVWWMDALGRHLDGATASPSSAQLDQYLLWAEDDVEAALDKELLK